MHGHRKYGFRSAYLTIGYFLFPIIPRTPAALHIRIRYSARERKVHGESLVSCCKLYFKVRTASNCRQFPVPVRVLFHRGGTFGPLKPEKLRFLRLDELNPHNTFEEDVPTCLHYSIKWKVSINKKVMSIDTEQDLVLVLYYNCNRFYLNSLISTPTCLEMSPRTLLLLLIILIHYLRNTLKS